MSGPDEAAVTETDEIAMTVPVSEPGGAAVTVPVSEKNSLLLSPIGGRDQNWD